MAREIKLNSNDWCDIVFDGKNKKYGAYELRQSSSKRHLVAFGTIVLFLAALLTLPMFLNAINPPKEVVFGGIDTERILVDMKEPEPEAIVDPIVNTPPPVRLKSSDMFTPPIVKPDQDVDESKELKDQETLHNSKNEISFVAIENPDDANAVSATLEQKQIMNVEPELVTKIFEVVEVMPKFMGGDAELMKYLSSNLKYPTIAIESNIQGRVVLKFVVRKDGNIDNVQVLRTLDPSCDKEAMRVLKTMPKWVPGMQNGRPVDVYFTLPVLFRLKN